MHLVFFDFNNSCKTSFRRVKAAVPRKHKKGSGAGEQPIREIKTVAYDVLWYNGYYTCFWHK